MGNLDEIYSKIPFKISQEKKDEIAKLEFIPLTRIRNNLTFQTFSHLFVLGRAPSDQYCGQPVTKWWCICDCSEHNIISVRVNNLTSGNTKSCGCHKKEVSTKLLEEVNERNKMHLEGKTIGNFLVLEDTGEKRYYSRVWRCKCLLCGNEEYYITTNTLMNHTPKSCGCEQRSLGIIKIDKILTNENISFIKEKTFPTCRFLDTNAPARFDYWIEKDNLLIEYDGEQHFKEQDLNYFRDTLKKRQEHDIFKNQWCKNNNIPLIRISYLDIDNINTYNDILKYQIKGENSC